MDRFEIAKRLMRCFPNSYINDSGEFIAHKKSNLYFILNNCETEIDVKCKVIEWFSRAAFKTQIYKNDKHNAEVHAFMLNGINSFLGTTFTDKDMELIYTYLGNACNHQKTLKFIDSGYDMSLLEGA